MENIPCKKCLVFSMCRAKVQEDGSLTPAIERCGIMRNYWETLLKPNNCLNLGEINKIRATFGFKPILKYETVWEDD
jgi:hypothetical protein